MKNKVDMNHMAKAEIIYAIVFSFILQLFIAIQTSLHPQFLILSFAYNVHTLTLSFMFYYVLLHLFSHHAILAHSWKSAFKWHGEGHSKYKFWLSDLVILIFSVGVFFYVIPPVSLLREGLNYFSGFFSLFFKGIFIALPVNIILRKFFNYKWTTNIVSSIIISPIYALFILAIIALR